MAHEKSPPAPPHPASRPPREEQTVYGVRACLALLEHRREDVYRIYHAPALREALGAHLSWAASRRLPYRELAPDALAKVADSAHHEGLVVVAAPLRYRALEPALARAAGAVALWLVLDRVENPFNLGALLRTAAFYGLSGLLAGGAAPGDKVNAAVLRVAEGGAEHVPLLAAPALPAALQVLRGAGCRVLGLETDGALVLGEAVAQGLTAGPLALVLGQERAGLSESARAACDGLCRLEGGGPLESLNVSVAAAVALTLVLRERPRPGPLAPPAARPTGPARPGGPRGRAGSRGQGGGRPKWQRQRPPRPDA
jgi:TrmH RNA methyltransferase